MKIPEEVVEKLKAGIKVSIKGETFTIVQHIVWRQARAQNTYDKYVLLDGNKEDTSRFFVADGVLGLAKLIHFDFREPLPDLLDYEGKKYKMLGNEFAVVQDSEGKTIYKVGDCEIFWDFVQEGNESQGLSLGRNWQTWEREDLAYQLIKPEEIEIL